MTHEEAERHERTLWRHTAPSGASIAKIEQANSYPPDPRDLADDSPAVDIMTSYGYGFGLSVEDFEAFVAAWLRHDADLAGRMARELGDPSVPLPDRLPKIAGTLPPTPKGIHSHADNARHAEKVRAVAGTLGVHDVPADSAEALRYLSTEELRALWYAAGDLRARIEAEGSTR